MGALVIVGLVIAGYGLALVMLARSPQFVAEPRIAQPFERAPGWEARTPPGTLVRQHDSEQHYAT
jgi:hypothetical protein